MIRRAAAVFFPLSAVLFHLTSSAQVTLHPTDNVPKIVSSKPPGTTFIFTPGTYRLSESIIAKDNDKFVGGTPCTPPKSSCPAIITGAIEIGGLAKPEGGNYAVAKQMQQGARGGPRVCDPGWEGCLYPEDLFFDDVPYKHLSSQTMPSIGTGEWWFDYNNHVIYFHDDPSNHKVETSVLNNAFGGPANNLLIQYLTIEKFANMYPVGAIAVYHGANQMTQGTNWTIENCEVRLNHGFGIRTSYRLRVLNNYIHDNGQMGIGGGMATPTDPANQAANSGILIQGNTINHNDYAHFNPGFGSGGVKFGGTSGVVLRGNTVEHNEGSGIHFDVDSNNELVDGNLITDNSDADGLVQELGEGNSIFRNNIVMRNGAHLNSNNFVYQIAVRASSGVDIYCNVVEVPPGQGISAWGIGASQRGSSQFPPFAYHTSTGNSFHYNTVIWEQGATGEAGVRQNDPQNQPNFFGSNTPPDYNSYHFSNASSAHFIYDNDNSKTNRLKNLSGVRSSHAEMHSTADDNYTSGFPIVSITSPIDQSSVANPVTISAKAEDRSGIKKIEFYVDWTLQQTVTSAPYDFNWSNGTTGPHTIAAMAYSNAGIRACYAVTLNEQ